MPYNKKVNDFLNREISRQHNAASKETVFSLDMGMFDNVESNIDVTFRKVVTVPVLENGQDTGIAIYVGLTSFAAAAQELKPPGHWQASLIDVAGRLKLVNEGDVQP